MVSAAALGGPTVLALDRLMTHFPAGWIASVFEPGRCLMNVRTSRHHEDVPHGCQFVLTPEWTDDRNHM